MKPAIKRAKRKPVKRAAGRPKVDEPKLSTTLRFDPQLIGELDAWAKDNGGMGRSAAIRLAVSNLVKGRDLHRGA
jgi:hypothetical protein